MRATRIVIGSLVTCLSVCAGMSLGQQAPTTGPAEPMANAPQFADRQHWPNLTGKEAFVTQAWPEARVLVWAKPGTSGQAQAGKGRTRNPIQVMNAADWLEYPASPDGSAGTSGKPASAPPDANTDIVLPDADKPYSVFLPAARHITIGRNATAAVPALTGNLWIKAGGRYRDASGRGGLGCLRIKGTQHTFLRNDNAMPRESDSAGARRQVLDRLVLGHDIVVQKYKDASVEFLGFNQISDEVVVWEGILIVGPDSTFKTGWPSTQVIGPEAALVLLSGARFAKEVSGGGPADIHVMGRLWAGTPQRPLTRDATLGVSSVSVQKSGKGEVKGGTFGLLIDRQASLAVHSAEPAKARLVLKWNEQKHRGEQTVAVGDKINLTLLGKLDLNGVLFDQVALGGIKLPDPSVRTLWKNVFYGPNNEGKPDQLYAKFEGDVPKAATQGMGYLDR